MITTTGCSDDELEAGEVRAALQKVPYEVKLGETVSGENGEGQVVQGTATNLSGTTLDFAIAVEGADMPRAVRRRLGGIGASSWDTGWIQYYGQIPGSRPDGSGGEETSLRVFRQRGKMSLAIEDELCRFVECPFP